MTDEPTETTGSLPRAALLTMVLLAGGLTLALLTSISAAWIGAVYTVIVEGGLAALVVASAGGYGYLVVRRVAPASAPLSLVVFTACAAGLWLFATAMLVLGSLARWAFSAWFWWPVVAAGVLLAAWMGRKRMEAWHVPKRLDGRALVWVLVAFAVGLWLAGATRPAGCWYRLEDEYDVLEYHLQVPREFYDARRVSTLEHNAYSHYPLGVEMLFLMGMCLRGGGYEGMYLAKLIHGAYAVLAVAALFGALKRDEDSRARFSAALLATTPFVLYLSWLAMVELAIVFHLALGVLWLRQWLRGGGWRAAWCVGIAAGGACAVKYLSVGFVVAPLLAAMLALSRRGARSALHAGALVAATLVLFSPWLIRNAAATGNPVFPLATRAFGAAYWSGESEQRWVDGHSPVYLPPVPKPPNWQPPPTPGRLENLYNNFLRSDIFGTLMMMTAGVAVCVLLASGARADPWDWALLAVLAVQVVVWTAFTHGMPGRFIMPSVVPLTLLAGGALARLARVKSSPFRKGGAAADEGSAWGRPPAVVIFAIIVAVNLLITGAVYRHYTWTRKPGTDQWVRLPPLHGVPGDQFAKAVMPWSIAHELPAQSRILLVGEARAFYFPPGTIYRTVWDDHPLAEMTRGGLSGREILRRLRDRGIDYIWVDWAELWRLANTYGCAEPFSRELFARQAAGRPPGLPALDKLRRLGMKQMIEYAPYQDGARPGAAWPVLTLYALPGAPVTTLPTTLPGSRTRPAEGG